MVECVLAVGEVVGHESVMSAARMNGTVVIFVSLDKANHLMEVGVTIQGALTDVHQPGQEGYHFQRPPIYQT